MARTLDPDSTCELAILKRNIQERVHRSERRANDICRAIKVDASWLSKFLKPASQTIPNSITLRRLANEFGCSVDDLHRAEPYPVTTSFQLQRGMASRLLREIQKLKTLARASEQQLIEMADRPNIMHILHCWLAGGKRLDGSFDQVLQYCDLLEPADDPAQIPNVRHLGPRSLSARALETTDASRLEFHIRQLDRAEILEINREMHSVIETGKVGVGDLERSVQAHGGERTHHLRFIRVQLPVTAPDGELLVLNVSDLVESRYSDTPLPTLPDRAPNPVLDQE